MGDCLHEYLVVDPGVALADLGPFPEPYVDFSTTSATPSEESSETHSDLEMDWAGNTSDNDSEDGWDALAPGSIDSLPVSDDHKFDERHAVCLGSEIVFDRVLATQDPDMLSRSFIKGMALRRAVELEQASASSHHLDQEFLRLGLVPPVIYSTPSWRDGV